VQAIVWLVRIFERGVDDDQRNFGSGTGQLLEPQPEGVGAIDHFNPDQLGGEHIDLVPQPIAFQ
jgi:hypothetical protein